MLVLARRTGESITVTNNQTGEQIEISLLSSKSGRSRIGIDGPSNYRVDRTEVLNRDSLAEMPQGG